MNKGLDSPLSKTNRWMDGQADRQTDTHTHTDEPSGRQTNMFEKKDEKTGRQADRHVFDTHMNEQMDMFQKDR